jgi:hypothetical protein
MRQTVVVASLLGWVVTQPLSAQESLPKWNPAGTAVSQLRPVSEAAGILPLLAPIPTEPRAELAADQAPMWETAWGVVGLRGIPVGRKVAPNGEPFHPNFSLDLNFNFWVLRQYGLYMFSDLRLWGETGQNGSTNGRDGFLGTSKREFDLWGGLAWNYAGAWEARAFGYTVNNLNRGTDPHLPSGFHDGFGLENRYYLSPEYARLGQTGFDVARATFVSIGYLPSKDMVGNGGDAFRPGLMARAYLTCDLWDWPCYLYSDTIYISERSLRPRLLLFDVGLATRPFPAHEQWEFRVGAENTADFRMHNVLSLGYVSIRYIY